VTPAIEPLTPTPEFLAAAEALGLSFDPGDVEQIGRYLAMLVQTNKQFNLTAVDDPAAVWMRHAVDALTLVPLLAELPQDAQVIDVGSGGGVPGVPLAICMPHVRFTLLEPTGKKAAFLKSVAETLGLGNVRVISDRAERVGQDKARHREKYDAAVARAVGAMNQLAELMVPLVRQGGVILAIKGAKADEELAAAREAIGLLGARHAQTIDTPTGRVIILEKASKTPNAYPRRDGEPKRKPLGSVTGGEQGGE
jgi:16S rRNA (guanine527-N7)-methyltransferase